MQFHCREPDEGETSGEIQNGGGKKNDFAKPSEPARVTRGEIKAARVAPSTGRRPRPVNKTLGFIGGAGIRHRGAETNTAPGRADWRRHVPR